MESFLMVLFLSLQTSTLFSSKNQPHFITESAIFSCPESPFPPTLRLSSLLLLLSKNQPPFFLYRALSFLPKSVQYLFKKPFLYLPRKWDQFLYPPLIHLPHVLKILSLFLFQVQDLSFPLIDSTNMGRQLTRTLSSLNIAHISSLYMLHFFLLFFFMPNRFGNSPSQKQNHIPSNQFLKNPLKNSSF